MKLFRPSRSIMYHVAAPFTGQPMDVLMEALSGHCSREIPQSFQKLHPSSRAKYEWKESLIGNLNQQVSYERITELVRLGAVWYHKLNRAGVMVLHRMTPSILESMESIDQGTYIKVYLYPKRYPPLQPKIVLNDSHFVIVDKPAGIPSIPHADNGIENAIENTREELRLDYLWTCHRLDIPTSGLLVFAKSKDSCSKFAALLKSKQITKQYTLQARRRQGVVNKLPEPGSEVTHYMHGVEIAPRLALDNSNEENGYIYPAILKMRDVNYTDEDTARCKVHLITGRTHQIRAQFAALGWPLQGDVLYGSDHIVGESPEDPYSPDIQLRCCSIAFTAYDKSYNVDLEDTENILES